MRRQSFLSGFVASLLTVGQASAADVGAAPAGAIDWTGFYAGGLLGAGFTRHQWTDVGNQAGGFVFDGTSRSFGSTGFVFGGFAGYNWQLSPSLLVGLESDLTYNTARSFKAWQPGFNYGIQSNGGLLWTGRARAGVTVDRLLLFVTGGLAVGNTDTRTNNSAFVVPPFADFNATRVGFVVGAGVEYMVQRNWTLRAEALYTDFGSRSMLAAPINGLSAGKVLRVRSSQTQIRLGAAYRF